MASAIARVLPNDDSQITVALISASFHRKHTTGATGRHPRKRGSGLSVHTGRSTPAGAHV